METQVTPEKLKQLVTTTGNNVWELAKRGKLLLVFLRMFACPYCRKAINDVNEISKSLKQLRVTVVFVHQGPEEMAIDVFNKFGSELIRSSDDETNTTEQIRDKLPFYEIVDPQCNFYRLFGLSHINKLNFVRKEWGTVMKAERRWGADSRKVNIYQLGAFFVLDQGGEVFSSLRQQGQTNIHDLAELVNVRQHVRFLPDHTKQVIYPSNRNYISHNNEEGDEEEEEKGEEEPEPVQIQEKHKEYRDFVHYAIADQPIYRRNSSEINEDNEQSNNAISSELQEEQDKDQSTLTTQQHRLPIPILTQSSKISNLLRCRSPNNKKERPYTEEDIKAVIESWSLLTVIEDEQLIQFFKTFCTKELSLENVLFYETIKHISQRIQTSIENYNVQNDINEINSEIEQLINEYLLQSSVNMVNVNESHHENFTSFLKQIKNIDEENDDKIISQLQKLQQYLKKAEDAVVLNMTDPFSRFRWSVEGERAAIYSIVQQ